MYTVCDLISGTHPHYPQVTFTAIVSSTSAAQPLGPSSGTVTFTISGSDAFKWVRPTALGTGPLSRVSVSGVAKLQMQHATEGITLLPGDQSQLLLKGQALCSPSDLTGVQSSHNACLAIRPSAPGSSLLPECETWYQTSVRLRHMCMHCRDIQRDSKVQRQLRWPLQTVARLYHLQN